MKRMNTLRTLFAVIILMQGVLAHAIKIQHGPYLQNVDEHEATIVWVSDSLSIGWVEIAPDDKSDFYMQARPQYFDTNIGIKTTSRIHSVRLTGLKAGTTYRYRIFSRRVLGHRGIHVYYGDTAASDVYSKEPLRFTTLDKKKQKVSFLVLNDIHDDNELQKTLLNVGDYKNKDLIFFNGDMISIFSDEDRFFKGFMDTAVNMFASETPFYYIRGNHETRGNAASTFHNYVCPRKENLYFAFQDGPVYFICLDTGEDKPDNDIEYSEITAYDAYRSEQAEWLKKVVESEAYRQAPLHVVVCHIPPYDDNGNWHGNEEVKNKLVPILDKANVDIMICGHLHRFITQEPHEGMSFPLVVNANTSCLKGTAENGELKIEITDKNGKQLYKRTIK